MSEEISDCKYSYNTKYRIIDLTRANLNNNENLASRYKRYFSTLYAFQYKIQIFKPRDLKLRSIPFG